MDATPSVALPHDADSGIPEMPPAPTVIAGRTFTWGVRTFLMGVINVTPDSFSGDGILALEIRDAVQAAVEQAQRMAAEGADILDIGGESTRPGHAVVNEEDERDRVQPIVRAIRAALPDMPLSIDTTKSSVAEAALDAGAGLINDVWGTSESSPMAAVAAAHGVPLVVMHNRDEPRYANVVAEVLADLQRALDRALAAGVAWDYLIVDPGIGFGKTAEQNLAVLRDLGLIATLGRPILLGTSRKSTIGKVLDLPADQRLEGTLATTALGVAGGADMVRVHDVQANLRVARMSDAIVRGAWQGSLAMADRIVLANMEFNAHVGAHEHERSERQTIEVDVEITADLRAAGQTDDLEQTVDYGLVFKRCRDIVEERSFSLLEAVAEAIASDLLAGFTRIKSVTVRVRKPGVPIDGVLEFAGVEIERSQ